MSDGVLKALRQKQDAKTRAAEESRRKARAKSQAEGLGRILGRKGTS